MSFVVEKKFYEDSLVTKFKINSKLDLSLLVCFPSFFYKDKVKGSIGIRSENAFTSAFKFKYGFRWDLNI